LVLRCSMFLTSLTFSANGRNAIPIRLRQGWKPRQAPAISKKIESRGALIVPKSAHWVDAARAAGWENACTQGRDHQQRNHDGERGRIAGAHSRYQLLYEACCRDSQRQAGTGADEHHLKALTEYQPHDIASRALKRHSHAHFRP